MNPLIFSLLGSIITLIATSLVWRWFSRRQQLPCPAWIAWLLETPLTESVAGTQITLDRIGLLPGEVGLDVGCGPGRLSIPADRRVGAKGRIVALDIQPKMLARLRARVSEAGLTNVEIHLGDITNENGLPEDHFDRVWLVTVLGEIPNRLAALSNIHGLLRPKGVLSITEIIPDPHYQRREVVLRLCREAGFAPTQYWGTALAFTQNFEKPK
ncbi:MAG: class I SAM-dependent methyltransferase [Anaerolineales bacterium]|jgi:ubiquinone/menaquinone biosynthesis C-methylase UbiE